MSTESLDEEAPLLGGLNVTARRPLCLMYLVEPLVVLTAVSDSALSAVRVQLFYAKVAEEMGIDLENITQDARVSCNDNKSDPQSVLRDRVQARDSDLGMYLTLAEFLPGLIMTLFYGIRSDSAGRRFTFLVPPIGTMLSALVDILVMCLNLPVWAFFLHVVDGFFGGTSTLMVGVNAYIADTSGLSDRGFRMALLDVLSLISASGTSLLIGYLITAHGFLWPYVVVLSLKAISVVYAFFLIPESVNASSAGRITFRQTFYRIRTQLWSGLHIFITDDGTGRLHKLRILLASYVASDVISGWNIFTLYIMNAPYCWTAGVIGIFNAFNMLFKCVTTLVGSRCLTRCLPIEWLSVLGRVCLVAECIYIALVKTSVMMFLEPLVGCFSYLAAPMTRAIMSALVSSNQQGAMIAVLTCTSRITGLIGTLTSNTIYAATLPIIHGLIFLLTAVTSLVSLVLVLIYAILLKKPKLRTVQIEK